MIYEIVREGHCGVADFIDTVLGEVEAFTEEHALQTFADNCFPKINKSSGEWRLGQLSKVFARKKYV